MWRKMMRYSLPLVPAALFWWITSVSDRYMITWFLGSGANGIYTVASKIPAIITLISGMFLEAWQFSAVRESRGSRRSYISFYTNIWSMFLTIMFIGGSIIIAFSPAAIRLLAASEYYSAAEYLPILTAAAILSSLVSFMGSVYIVTKRSSLSFLTTAAGAVFNIILNFLLIPTHLGIYGAAIATLCSYLLSFLIRIISIRNILPFRIYGGRLLMSILIIAVQIISSSWDGHLNTGIQLSCFLSLAAINIHPLIAYVKSSRL